jgi:phage N-6-adenine-methyltransferase
MCKRIESSVTGAEKMNTKLFFQLSRTDLWSTPINLFRRLDKEFNFTLDVCAVKENAKCKHYFTKEDNGLTKLWFGRCWMNPPYGKIISLWLEKAYKSLEFDTEIVVCLIPVRTDAPWWHKYVMKASEVRFITRRVAFGNTEVPAPFPSAIVVYSKTNLNNPVFSSYHYRHRDVVI